MNGNSRVGPDSFCFGNSSRGFTILEVIVSLIIVAVSLTAFIQLLGNSTHLRVKINDHHDRLNVAVTKAEEAFLGLLDGSGIKGADKNSWQGTIQDTGITWRVEEEKEEKDDSNTGDGGREVFFYTVLVEGVELSSIRIEQGIPGG
ncbi:MAG: type II secretion system GspH family protein [Candidatus Scalindua sp.]|nr:type II secretion system GspH family protein [Candidatus Scalindua sp.]